MRHIPSVLVSLWFGCSNTALADDIGTVAVDRQDEAPASGDLFRSRVAAAEAERTAGRLAAAVEKYRRVALEFHATPQAAEAHRLAILCMAELLRASAVSERDALTRSYVALIEEHLEHWPAEPTADDVRLWQAQLLAARQDYPAAIAVLQQVRPSSEAFADSVRLVVACYGVQMRSSQRGGETTTAERAQLLASATQFLQRIITGKENRWPETWSDLQRDTAVDLARLYLRYSDPSSPYAEQLLTAAIRGSDDASGDEVQTWRAEAQSLLIAALTKRGKTAEAQEVAKLLANPPPDVMLETLDILDELKATPTDGAKPPFDLAQGSPFDKAQGKQAVGQLALELAQLVEARHTELDGEQLARLDRYRAGALATTGDWAGAATQYAAIAQASPDDGEVQESYAALLTQSDSPEHLRQALVRWTAVERRSRRGGERWLRARRARIELLNRLGEQAEAEKLVRLTRLLYPEWDAASSR